MSRSGVLPSDVQNCSQACCRICTSALMAVGAASCLPQWSLKRVSLLPSLCAVPRPSHHNRFHFWLQSRYGKVFLLKRPVTTQSKYGRTLDVSECYWQITWLIYFWLILHSPIRNLVSCVFSLIVTCMHAYWDLFRMCFSFYFPIPHPHTLVSTVTAYIFFFHLHFWNSLLIFVPSPSLDPLYVVSSFVVDLDGLPVH